MPNKQQAVVKICEDVGDDRQRAYLNSVLTYWSLRIMARHFEIILERSPIVIKSTLITWNNAEPNPPQFSDAYMRHEISMSLGDSVQYLLKRYLNVYK